MNKNNRRLLLAVILLLPGAVPFAAELVADPPHVCDPCVEWNQPRAPFHVYGSTWFVGTGGLGSILITSPKGHILIDGGLPQSAPLIARNIEAAGFKLADVKLILNSHTHYDHAGGIAALARVSHAQVAASPASKLALERGGPMEDDPQFGFGAQANDFPAVRAVRAIADGETLRVGDLAVTAHFTPGHTPGGTTWSWLECESQAQNKACLHIVYADSLNSVSAPGFRFSGDAQHASRVEVFERSIDEVANLPCDILLAAHPAFVDLDAKLARWKENPRVNALLDTGACKAYAAGARERLATRLAEERAAK
ncbi:MAG TPA: subclass B3 metallo-beta-lactamase [Steroidobacteraceae bacterium]|nr:subclass B3 metallo-beta-lactamase [Steroidobacteraceae bacterium]